MTFAAAILAFLGFALLILLHEAGHFSAAKAVGMRVERFAVFFPLPWRGKMRYLARWQRGETEYAIGPIPLGGFVRITGMNPSEEMPDEVRTRAYWSQALWKRMVVIAAGPAVNLVLALVLLVLFFWQIGPETAVVGRIEPGYPAAGVVRPGDRPLAVDGKRGSPGELIDAVGAHTCAEKPPVDGCNAATPATLTVLRDGRELDLKLTPVYDARAERSRVGFSYEPGPREPLPFGTAVERSADGFWLITKETVKIPARLFDAERRKEISGIVGSYEVTRRTIMADAEQVVFILAVISLSLAVINLFPFLPLDGGHIFWGIVEKLRRRPVSYGVMERSGVVGFMLVIVLFFVGFTNDIERLTGEGFGVR